MIKIPGDDVLLTPQQVAAVFRVDPKTVTRWDKAGHFPKGTVIRTVGGHRRFRREQVEWMLNGGSDGVPE